MQWIAMVTMLIDHIGAIFFPNEYMFRIIGRIAFPIYVYLLVVGYERTRSYWKYAARLGLLAILSQLPYQYAFDTTGLNVIVTLLVSLLIIKWLDWTKIPLTLRLTSLVIVLIAIEIISDTYISFDYGAYGVLLALLYRYVKPHMQLVIQFALEIVFMIHHGWAFQFVSMVVTYVISFQPRVVQILNAYRAPNMIWRSFYPLHLVIFSLIIYFY